MPRAKAKAKPKVPAVRKMGGPPSLYTPELGEEICARIAMGETLRGICYRPSELEIGDRIVNGLPALPEPTLPTEYTVRSWLGKFPEFHKLYFVARQLQADRLFDEIVDISMGLIDVTRREPGKVYRDREIATAVRALQWAAGKLKPQEYGERSVIDPGTTIHIQTTLDMNNQGSAPVAGGKTTYEIVAEPLETATQKAARLTKEKPDGKPTKPK